MKIPNLHPSVYIWSHMHPIFPGLYANFGPEYLTIISKMGNPKKQHKLELESYFSL